MSQAPFRVAHVDDHDSIRDGVQASLSQPGPHRFAIVASVATAEQLLDMLRARRLAPPDAVLLDLQLPGMSGTDAVRAFSSLSIPVVVYANAIAEHVPACVAAGAAAVVDKGHGRDALRRTLAEVCGDEGARASGFALSSSAALAVLPTIALPPMTARVVECFADGMTRREVMSSLGGLNEKTLRRHLAVVRDALVEVGILTLSAQLRDVEKTLKDPQKRPQVDVRDGRRAKRRP